MNLLHITIDNSQTLSKVCRDVKAKEEDARLGINNERDRLESLVSQVDNKEVRELADIGVRMKIAKLHNGVRAKAIRELGEALYSGEVYRTGNY
jgi:hypothetical protein